MPSARLGRVPLPGVGWRGWDAMHGVRTGDGHIALRSDTGRYLPVEGSFSFQGAAVRSTLDYSVHIAAGASS